MIRDALIQDVPQMLDRAKISHSKSVHRHIPFERRDCEKVFSDLIRNEAGLVLTDGFGAFYAGVMDIFPWNRGYHRFIEIGYDGVPLSALIPALKERLPAGTEISIGSEPGPKAKARSRLYRMHGFKPSVLSYTLTL